MSNTDARVLVAHSDHGSALVADGSMVSFNFRKGGDRPLAGDRIELDDDHRLVSIHPRTTVFGRGDHAGRFRPTAANIDQLLIVVAPEPLPSLDLITRYLVMAELHQITPIVVVNKADLGVPQRPPFTDLEALTKLGYTTLAVSAKSNENLAPLQALTAGKVSLLAGQSGVGKSSILNALIPDTEILTGQLSNATGKGKHTTTTTRFYPLPYGGFLVDSPGVWEYGLWAIPTEELAHAFRDFRPFLGQCRFRDCTHDHEPHCAVIKALKDGMIDESRHEAWRRLLREQARYSK